MFAYHMGDVGPTPKVLRVIFVVSVNGLTVPCGLGLVSSCKSKVFVGFG